MTRPSPASTGPGWSRASLHGARYSQSLERGLAILECFTPEEPLLGIAELADRLDMSRSTIHRYVSTLALLGYLDQGAERKYRLGLRVTDLGMSALNCTGLRDHAHHDLAGLAHQTGYTTSLATLDGQEIVYIDSVQGFRRWPALTAPRPAAGSRLPAHCTALGKILLAHLPEITQLRLLTDMQLNPLTPNTITNKRALQDELAQACQEGFAIEDQELTKGRIALAAPVTNQAGEVEAAIDITAATPAMTIEQLASRLGPQLIAVAEHISARLGYRQHQNEW